jgi:hypothetical protein
MGGTYVTHHFGYVLGELQRYKMDRDLIVTHQEGYENNYYTLNVEGTSGNTGFFATKLNDTY